MSFKAGQSLLTLFGLAFVSVLSYHAGKSKGQEQREALQREILRMQAVARRRNAEVQQLRAQVANVDAELSALGVQREAMELFAEWLEEVHPVVLEHYRMLQQTEGRIATLDLELSTWHEAARTRYDELCRRFPDEAGRLSESDRQMLSQVVGAGEK